MPHVAIYRRPERRPLQEFTVHVSTTEGHEQYLIHAETKTQAEREALEIYAAERDTQINIWTEAR